MMLAIMKTRRKLTPAAPGGDYTALREDFAQRNAHLPLEPGVAFLDAGEFGGVPVEVATLEGVDPEDAPVAVLYLHGGGFAMGDRSTGRSFTSYLAALTGFPVYSCSYRLAPEHKAPLAALDCLTVYRQLRQDSPDRPVVVVGESAGASLALVTALWARDEGVVPPVALVAFSPVTNLADDLPSRTTNAESDIALSGDGVKALADIYGGGADLRDPYVSPAFGDFRGFPPLFLVADRSEVVIDDADALAESVRAAGGSVEYHVTEGLFHTFQLLGRLLPEAEAIMSETVGFIQRHTAPPL
jgi:acetyl esterase/lipase